MPSNKSISIISIEKRLPFTSSTNGHLKNFSYIRRQIRAISNNLSWLFKRYSCSFKQKLRTQKEYDNEHRNYRLRQNGKRN